MKKILLMAIITLFSASSLASPATYLEKNKPAPYTGYLFTPEQEKFVRKAVEERDILLKVKDEQSDLIIVYDKKIEIYDRVNKDLKEQIASNKTASIFDKILYFGVGILLGFTVGSIYNGR